MFEGLEKYKKIIVTGPQRSGTTIAARMIAADTGHKYEDEKTIRLCDKKIAERKLSKGNVVLQAPGLAHVCHEFDEDVFVVFMLRDVNDIIASEKRIHWECEKEELKKYEARFGPICAVKYDKWKVQRTIIPARFELHYETLKGHKLWVDKSERGKFKPRQWKKGKSDE